jgi:hypothetical protein
MTIDDVDTLEINEAFAAQVIPSARALGVDPFSDKLNPFGGAIALGHPFGMTGARIMCTLLNGLRDPGSDDWPRDDVRRRRSGHGDRRRASKLRLVRAAQAGNSTSRVPCLTTWAAGPWRSARRQTAAVHEAQCAEQERQRDDQCERVLPDKRRQRRRIRAIQPACSVQ